MGACRSSSTMKPMLLLRWDQVGAWIKPAEAPQGAFSQIFVSGTVKEIPKGVRFGGLADAFDETQARDLFDRLSCCSYS